MQRSLLLLALAALFVGCNTSKTTATSGVASGEARFSWEKDAPAPAADPARTSVRTVRADLSLLEIGAIEKRDPGTRPLGGDRGGKALLDEFADLVTEVEVADDGVLFDIDDPATLAAARKG
jgi:hypothetical protein